MNSMSEAIKTTASVSSRMDAWPVCQGFRLIKQYQGMQDDIADSLSLWGGYQLS